ncbi:unnamed protein product [Paramecium pentaurelia]|uniref:Niemann-Pick C1 N-terminal domain-containing protein n=1 Tax=Paramecium pentaurelia TaxID=43138 RepID=A0A8S1VEJ9_9CILI|nr:unnamed protein product [Paramecium pentaurelia]
MKIQIFLILLYYCNSRCAFTVDDKDKPIETDKDPEIIGVVEACPFFSGQPVCCTRSQDRSMVKDFKSLDATFGNDGGGCDICGSNMKRFWCHYTCSPNQSEFMKITGRQNMTDPLNSSKIIEVQMVTLEVHPQIACEVFSSCKRTSFATQVSAMASPGGFFTFQGEQAVGEGGQYINVEFQESNSLYFDDIWACNHNYSYTTKDETGIHYWDDFGYELHGECGCNTCEFSCQPDKILYEPPGILYGFEGTYILFAWGWAILLSLAITIIRRCQQKKIELSDLEEQKQILG